MNKYKELRSALSRVNAASEWAEQAGLLNISGELKGAAREIRKFLLHAPLVPEKGE